MPKKAGLLGGPKIGGKHGTYIDEVPVVLRAAREDAAVTKIVIGEIRPTGRGGNAERRIKLLPVTGGFRVQVRGVNAVQFVFVYTTDPVGTEARIMYAWDRGIREVLRGT